MATRAVSTVAYYRAWDTSANTPKTGDSANHTLRWVKDGTSAATTNSPAEVDATNAPGLYKVTLTATETDCVFGCLTGKSSTANIYLFGVQIGFEYVPTSATTFGAFIGNATAAIAVDANGRLDVIKVAGTSQTARDLGASVLISSGTGTGQLDVTSGVIKANLAQILGTALTETAGQIAAAFKKLFNVAVPVLTAESVNQTGDNYARLGAPAGASVSADIAAVNTKTTNLPASPAAVGSAMTLTSAYDFAKGTVAMTEAYAAVTTAPTPVQAIFMMLARAGVNKRALSGTTETAYKLDGTTAAMTFTLDDATNPTSSARAT